VTKKLAAPVAHSTARQVVSSYGAWVLQPTTPVTVTRAIDIAAVAQIQFRDALIVASAEQADATRLYSEDLNAGQTIAGVKIVNPLVVA
jgi:predicted nucleic acid-binding protein